MLANLISFFNQLHDLVWGAPMITVMLCLGFWLTLRTRGMQVRRLPTMLRTVIHNMLHPAGAGGVPPFKAMSTALAGTIGTGNIVGVATAIAVGGPGAIFWMWVSAFFGMMTKFAEVTLAVKYRRRDADGRYHGGPMVYIVDGLGHRFKFLAVIFAVCCMAAAFGIGNIAQINSISLSLHSAFHVPKIAVGLAVAALCLAVIGGGVKRITDFTGFFVPFMSIFFTLGAIIVIASHGDRVPAALLSIVRGAFCFTSAAGGAIGYTAAAAMRFGVARGVFTNEAGMGSAPIAHACADVTEPVEQGYFGALEVFFDTIVMCSITALVVLTSGAWLSGNHGDGADLTARAFGEVMGPLGQIFIAVAVTLFAFCSIIGWEFYAEQCCRFLTPRRAILRGYRAAFTLVLVIGSVAGLSAVWGVSDTLNGLMAVPNLLALTLLSGRVIAAVERYEKRKRS